MTATDLMVGDWVQGFLPDTYSRVCKIENETWLGIIADGKAYIELSADDIQPVPLTPEILEKNGFNEQGKGENYTDYVLVLKIERVQAPILICFYKETVEGVSILFKCRRSVCNGGGINDLHLCTLNYVHELQHALKLCGITKEIII